MHRALVLTEIDGGTLGCFHRNLNLLVLAISIFFFLYGSKGINKLWLLSQSFKNFPSKNIHGEKNDMHKCSF